MPIEPSYADAVPVLESFRLDGKRAVVTGASRGIGAALAVALAQAGADVVGVARGDASETAVRVQATGRSFHSVRADLAQPDAAQRVVAEVERIGDVHILVNNAGYAERNPAESHTDAQWDGVIAVDLTSPFLLARELGARMLDRGSGKIVFVASVMTFQGGRDVVSYAAAKSGIAGLVHALANEWTGRGVQVNAIAPGYIETDLTIGTHGDSSRRQEIQERVPSGRWGSPADLSGAVVFLTSSASDYVSGVVLPVDGGWLVR